MLGWMPYRGGVVVAALVEAGSAVPSLVTGRVTFVAGTARVVAMVTPGGIVLFPLPCITYYVRVRWGAMRVNIQHRCCGTL